MFSSRLSFLILYHVHDNFSSAGLVSRVHYKTSIKRINAGAVAEQFIHLFNRIESNQDVMQVPTLKDELDALLKVENLPSELRAQNQLSEQKLMEGRRIKERWDGTMETILLKYDQLLAHHDIYSGLIALQSFNSPTLHSCFAGSTYTITDCFKQEIQAYRLKISKIINPLLSAWIAEQRCSSVEKISDYRKHMRRLQSILTDLNYTAESEQAEAKCRIELENKEALLERQTLLSNCKTFLNREECSNKTPYTTLLHRQHECELLLGGLSKHSKTLGEEADRLSSRLIDRLDTIQALIKNIKQQMNDIWDDLYAIENLDAVKSLISSIQSVCQLGIEETDLADYKALESALQSFLDATNDIVECRADRDLFEISKQKYLALFESADYDFDVMSILKSVIASIETELNTKDKQWCNRYLDSIPTTRSEMMKWVDSTEVLPNYLSAETKASYQLKLKQVSAEIHKAEVEFVVFRFQRLDSNQMQQCYQALTEIMQTPENPPNIAGSDISQEESSSHSNNASWDIEEWVVLIDLYYKNPMYTRKELEVTLIPYSNMLIHRAEILNIPTSPTYRNINGLFMQMDRIKYSITNRGTAFSGTSKTQEIAMDLYHNDIEKFNQIRDLCWEKFG
ncbi:hypothetical protein RFF05_12655 [Bengtsoniella intestinalis]|uniref:hypothetical protein n=1 Tax=Bengtsoniella intestinalis TaxID=3073143 RepID=UPI00391F4E32